MSPITVLGTAVYNNGAPLDQPAQLEMRIEGTGDIDDDCPDASDGRFVAFYSGELVPDEDDDTRNFTASVYPDSPTLFTPSGCEIHALLDPHVSAVSLTGRTATAGSVVGHGTLTFQILDDVDQSALETGAFDDLWATLVFDPDS